jgi:hypothetical protein
MKLLGYLFNGLVEYMFGHCQWARDLGVSGSMELNYMVKCGEYGLYSQYGSNKVNNG